MQEFFMKSVSTQKCIYINRFSIKHSSNKVKITYAGSLYSTFCTVRIYISHSQLRIVLSYIVHSTHNLSVSCVHCVIVPHITNNRCPICFIMFIARSGSWEGRPQCPQRETRSSGWEGRSTRGSDHRRCRRYG